MLGIRTPIESAYTPIDFEAKEPLRVLVGYFRSDDRKFRKPPTLETDALAAEHGGQEVILPDAIKIESMPPCDVHALNFGPGKQKLEVPGEGVFVILGFVKDSSSSNK